MTVNLTLDIAAHVIDGRDWSTGNSAPLIGSAADAPVGPAVPSGRRLAEAVYAARRSPWPNGPHGADHWLRVARNALMLALATDGADLEVCLLFAALHDSCRWDDGCDADHGRRAALLAQGLNGDVFALEPRRLSVLMYALEHHNGGTVSDDPTTGACWDADRVDLPRVGLRLDRELMSTRLGRSVASGPGKAWDHLTRLDRGWDEILDAYRAELSTEVPRRPGDDWFHGTHAYAAAAILGEGLSAGSYVSRLRSWANACGLRAILRKRGELHAERVPQWQVPGGIFAVRIPSRMLARSPYVTQQDSESLLPEGCGVECLQRVWHLDILDATPPSEAWMEEFERVRAIDQSVTGLVQWAA